MGCETDSIQRMASETENDAGHAGGFRAKAYLSLSNYPPSDHMCGPWSSETQKS